MHFRLRLHSLNIRFDPFPLLLSRSIPADRAAGSPQLGLVGISNDRRLLHWISEVKGGRQLTDAVAQLSERPAGVVLTALAVWIGLYPAPFLDRINLSVLKVAARVDATYAPAFAAACDTTVTPQMLAANPANQFLAAAPCGPDGKPLTGAADGGAGGGR